MTSAFFVGIDDDRAEIGNYGLVFGAAASMETDAVDHRWGSPADVFVLGSADNFPGKYMPLDLDRYAPYPHEGPPRPDIRADIVYFETASGGAVFSVGSIGWCGSLSANHYQNDVSTLTRNALDVLLSRRSLFEN